MRINIASPGRFHVMDLARELTKYGHEVNFYSYVPTKRAVKFGLPKECNHSFLWIMAPFLLLMKLFPKFKRHILPISIYVQDYVTGWFMKPCDVFIVMSESFVYAAKKAKQSGAYVIMERGSKHGKVWRKILDEIEIMKGKKTYYQESKLYDRENEGYKYADLISVPSLHVKESFVEQRFDPRKLFVNVYGVDVKDFTPTVLDSEDIYDVLFVGGWSYYKGCDLLAQACLEILNIKLLHVGGIADCPMPTNPNFKHIDPVNQPDLIKYYRKATVFCLPSRQDGFGMVLSQALACGLPIVSSKDTGGPDLKKFIPDKRYIAVMEEFTVEELAKCIQQALELADTQPEGQPRSYCGNALEQLTWEAYGRRYNAKIEEIAKERAL